MVRPRKTKFVNFQPEVTYFKPRAVPLNRLEEVELTYDELETLRLSNIEKLSQSMAAEKMDVHQSTFQRTLTRAREKITDALVNGKAIKITGGEYITSKIIESELESESNTFRQNQNNGFGRGSMGGDLAGGPNGECVCPKCGHTQKHQRKISCSSINCPKCNTLMTRG